MRPARWSTRRRCEEGGRRCGVGSRGRAAGGPRVWSVPSLWQLLKFASYSRASSFSVASITPRVCLIRAFVWYRGFPFDMSRGAIVHLHFYCSRPRICTLHFDSSLCDYIGAALPSDLRPLSDNPAQLMNEDEIQHTIIKLWMNRIGNAISN